MRPSESNIGNIDGLPLLRGAEFAEVCYALPIHLSGRLERGEPISLGDVAPLDLSGVAAVRFTKCFIIVARVDHERSRRTAPLAWLNSHLRGLAHMKPHNGAQ